MPDLDISLVLPEKLQSQAAKVLIPALLREPALLPQKNDRVHWLKTDLTVISRTWNFDATPPLLTLHLVEAG